MAWYNIFWKECLICTCRFYRVPVVMRPLAPRSVSATDGVHFTNSNSATTQRNAALVTTARHRHSAKHFTEQSSVGETAVVNRVAAVIEMRRYERHVISCTLLLLFRRVWCYISALSVSLSKHLVQNTGNFGACCSTGIFYIYVLFFVCDLYTRLLSVDVTLYRTYIYTVGQKNKKL